jgi:conjugative transfer signal peptidase TraF
MGDRAIPRKLVLLGLVALGLGALYRPQTTPWVVYNASASLPRGFYLTRPVSGLAQGDLVLAHVPETARQLAAQRGYLPPDVPLIKPIAALAGDHVCVTASQVLIDDRYVIGLLLNDYAGRSLPIWQGCRALMQDEVFLLSTHAAGSFDSRYFGPVGRAAVLARLVPLWTW